MDNPVSQVNLATDLDNTDDRIIDIQTTETSAYGIWEIFFEDIGGNFVGCGLISVRNPCDGKDLTTITQDKFVKIIQSEILTTSSFESPYITFHNLLDNIKIVQPHVAVECTTIVDDESYSTEYELRVIGVRYDNYLYGEEWWSRRQLDDVSQEELEDYGSYLDSKFIIIGDDYLINSIYASFWSGIYDVIIDMRPLAYAQDAAHSIA